MRQRTVHFKAAWIDFPGCFGAVQRAAWLDQMAAVIESTLPEKRAKFDKGWGDFFYLQMVQTEFL